MSGTETQVSGGRIQVSGRKFLTGNGEPVTRNELLSILGMVEPGGIEPPARPRGFRGVAKPVRLPQGYVAVAITNPDYIRQPLSPTFHGRDVFAPVAAHLTLGVEVDSFGERVASVLALPLFRAVRRADGSLAGRVIHIDRFGNLVTSIRAVDIGGNDVTVEIEGAVLHGLATTYGDGDDLVALIGSNGYLEVALPHGSAAQLLDADLDAPVTVRPVVVRMKRPQ